MPYETDLQRTGVPEKSTCLITFIVKDENGLPLAGSDLDTLKVTLFNEASGEIINGIENLSILNENNGEVDENGNGAWTLEPDQNALIEQARETECHRAMFEWSYASGEKIGRHRIKISIVNFEKVA